MNRPQALDPAMRVLVVAVALAILAAPLLAPPARESGLRRPARLPVNFPHAQHGDVACAACHHNYVDGRGQLPCVDCHRGAGVALLVGAEPRFHQFCRTCHQERAARGQKHGPIRDCAGCHQPEKW